MTNANHLPLALYRANLELWLRIGQLLEENRDQWTDMLAHELNERMAAARGESGRFPAAPDWSTAGMLPGSELWRLAEQQVSDLQALAQTASGNQMTFVNGFQQALEQWQQATASAFSEAAGEASLPAQPFEGLHETLQGLSNALLSGIGAATAPAAPPRPAAGQAVAKKPAPRKAPVRKTARPAKKAAAKKTAAKKAVKKTAAGKTAKRATKKATSKAAPKKTAKKTTKKTARKAARR